ncbi:MAG: NADP-reducing hydrogenase subunit HndC [candidate division WS2 bacterium]|uniref:NADP-reducing hydrogenase subunit HndC n=1 Tax=Psychracetigena formicireducens TaxID=2986056 RepID=A0A9E2F0T9_PSYF1|nr:NADP-reducing hydrogenase subunit HndC [Candidatus Psychracetigena formicireducens]
MKLFRIHALVCAGTGCISSGSKKLEEALIEQLQSYNLSDEVQVIETGCRGACEQGPLVLIYPEGVIYRKVTTEDVKDIVEEHFLKGRLVERLLFTEPGKDQVIPTIDEVPFFKKQARFVLQNCGTIDPYKIEEYIARDGYFALAKALYEMSPEQVIEEIKTSGLRGRGGAGFPTGVKWEFCREADGSPKYIICNADEGDPGAFMDRSILEGSSYSVIEGMTIAAYAIGATKGYVYVRAEYPLAIERLEWAIKEAKNKGLLGSDILGSGFNFDIEIRIGAGAFVCGEETALLASIEGKRGEPRPRPPYPAQKGLWDKPTIINNVETLANIPLIIFHGYQWFRNMGTEKSPGTKVFALAGKVNNSGLVEIPMGLPLKDVIYEIGGGIPKGEKFKAALTGGPSGGVIPSHMINTPLDFESLAAIGAIMGSGGLIILDRSSCMVDLAKFFLTFTADESCGKCPPCRVGTHELLKILKRITHGQGTLEDLDLIESIGLMVKQASLCGLGQTAPNPVLSTLKHFRQEYETHIIDKRCPAGVCNSLMISPCENECPINLNVPAYLQLCLEGKIFDAYSVIMEENPLPAICGRVCHRPCEEVCRRNQVDASVAIDDVKRYIVDYIYSHWDEYQAYVKDKGIKKLAPNNHRVAIVGSGPAGLTAAFFLAKLGYKVTIFEAKNEAGGMLRYAIPDYRLPKEILKKEIKNITDLGVEIKLNTKVGKDISLEQLKREGYEAVLVAIGAAKGQTLKIDGSELKGVWSGLEFLDKVNSNEKITIGEKVVVIGGGNVAIDAARSSLRLGAREVTILYRREKEDMPADHREIEEAEHEGINFILLGAPTAIVGKDDKVIAIKYAKMTLGYFDDNGRRVPTSTNEEELKYCDTVILAVGQSIETEGLLRETGIQLTRNGQVIVNQHTLESSIPMVYAGGDVVTGPATVSGSMSQGKWFARTIDAYFNGGEDRLSQLKTVYDFALVIPPEEEVSVKRQEPGMLSSTKRISNFKEVVKSFNFEQVITECGRCLRCDVKEVTDEE